MLGCKRTNHGHNMNVSTIELPDLDQNDHFKHLVLILGVKKAATLLTLDGGAGKRGEGL